MSPVATPPRRAALEVMRDLRRGELLDRAFDRRTADLDPRDRAFARELAHGTQRLRGRIDRLIAARARGGIGSLEPDVLDVLRLGVYQMLEMGSVPVYAGISQSVELVRFAGSPRAAGLVNGILRALDRARGELAADFPDAERDPVGHLASWGSHPQWLVSRWVERYGTADAGRLIEADNTRPDLYVRAVGITTEEAAERLREAGIDALPVDLSPRSLRLREASEVGAALAAAPLVVQDPAAALVVDYAAVPEGAVVLDLCAAPGGKTVGVAERAGFVAAADLSLGRLRRVGENVNRVGVAGRVGMVAADAMLPPFAAADMVFIDAPCSGTGTLRRHPDGRWRVTPQALEALSRLQAEILFAGAGLVRPGGLLVYGTCSLEPEENEMQVEAFLERHPGFSREPQDGAVAPALLDAEGSLRVTPQRHGVDGAYAVRLRRHD